MPVEVKLEEKEFEIVKISKLGIGSKSHALLSVVFLMDGEPCESWVLFSGQDDGIEVGSCCHIDRSLPYSTWIPLINSAREFLNAQKTR